jgi:hypothetical protein
MIIQINYIFQNVFTEHQILWALTIILAPPKICGHLNWENEFKNKNFPLHHSPLIPPLLLL